VVWAAVLTTLLVLVGVVVVLVFTPLFSVRGVTVEPAPEAQLSADLTEAVRAAVDVPAGTPLLRVDLDGVGLPEVASVQVRRGWPDSLAVEVTPRTAVAVTQANGQWWLLDRTGEPYLVVDAPPPGVPVVELATPGVDDPATVAALVVAQGLTDPIRSQVSRISARTGSDVTLVLGDGRTVQWGPATDDDAGRADTARKLEVLPAVLAQPGTSYDVSDPTLVSVR
jgi:cell division protein FtsQ